MYGKVEDIDKADAKKIQIEGLYVAMSLAVKDRNAEAIIAAMLEVAKLSKIHDDQSPLSLEDLMPVRIVKYVHNNVKINNNNDTGLEDLLPCVRKRLSD